MTAPIEQDASDSSPLAPPADWAQETRLAEVLERSNVLLDALRLSDSPPEIRAGSSSTISNALLRRRRRRDEAEEAKEDSGLPETAMVDATLTTTGTRGTTSTSTTPAVPDTNNAGQPPSPNAPGPDDEVESEGPFYLDLNDEDDQQRRRPMRRRPRRRSRSREAAAVTDAAVQESNVADDDGAATTPSMSTAELLAPRVSERHVSAFYQNIMAQVELLEEQEGRQRPAANDADRRMNTRGARGA